MYNWHVVWYMAKVHGYKSEEHLLEIAKAKPREKA